MNRNNFWRFVLVALVLAFAIFELIPPTPRPLLTVFQEKARNRDANFNAIVKQAQSLEKVQPGRSYENLKEAVGTNDLVRYFPIYEAKEQLKPKAYILNRLQRDAAGRIRLGLDLQGGTSFRVRMDTNGLSNASDTGAALSQAVEVLRKRVDRFGVAEPLIQPEGNDRILVQLPGLSAAEQQTAEETIKRAAFLEFKLVHDQSDELIKQGFPEPGYQIMRRKEKLQDGREVTEEVMVKQRAEMTGGVKTAMVTRGNLGEPEISFELDSKAADRFGQITKENVGKRLAIILDGELYSAPVIRSPIENGRGSISGRFDQK